MSYTSLNKGILLPREEMLEVAHKQKHLVIGIPREIHDSESRVPLTPESVEILVNTGHDVIIESGAGKGSNYDDKDYSECGGFIINSRNDVLKADVVMKVAPFHQEDIELFKGNQIIISSIHLNGNGRDLMRGIMQKKVTAVDYENIKDEYNEFPVERTMDAISGNTAILIAAEYLSNAFNGKGVMLGGIPGITPTEVVILGAGTAAEYAARAAMGMGAVVKIFDTSTFRLRNLQNMLGQRLYTSVFHPRVLQKALKSADVVIGALPHTEDCRNYFITEDMIREMKRGSVIIDLSIDQGGCMETSEYRDKKDPFYVKHGILHYCVTNMPSRVARTASIAFSNVFTPLLLRMGQSGSLNQFLKEDPGFRNGVYVFNGILTNQHIGKYLDIPSQNIELLLAAF